MNITIPEFALVVLIGTSGSGKSTFAKTHFKPTEVLSSDFCRGLVSDDDNNQTATDDAFDVLHYIARKRLARKRLTVVDATNIRREDRAGLVKLAREYHCLPVAIVFNLPTSVAIERNRTRPDRNFGKQVIIRQHSTLRRGLRGLKREGFRQSVFLKSEEEVNAVTIERQPLWNDKRDEHGPFDFIGDIHGCTDELELLLDTLGYQYETVDDSPFGYDRVYAHPEGRKAVFVGDLVDRGPRILDAIGLVANMVQANHALCVQGNHDAKFVRYLKGRNVTQTYGLDKSVAEVEALPEAIRTERKRALHDFLYGLISHYVFDDGKLVVAHAGLPEDLQGRASGRVREVAMYGEPDDPDVPLRDKWAQAYRGKALVVYGHVTIPEPKWLNNTINIDTGCVYGRSLTALRYPERELVSVPALQQYAESERLKALLQASAEAALTAQQEHDGILDIIDVTGKRIVNTRLRPNITIRAENSVAALEVMSRFAANPKWLIYLPPTMSPVETSKRADYLEHPDEALAYFRAQGVEQVVCEEKHMGSRAIVIVCRDVAVAQARFGVESGETGIVYTRTGRRFFKNAALENGLLAAVREGLNAAEFWTRHNTDWVCLDCELMPWSTKAQALLQEQYAAVGAAAGASLAAATPILQQAAARGLAVDKLLQANAAQTQSISRYIGGYRNYCWPVTSLSDLRLAPFHILATEGAVHVDKSHIWHMEEIGRIVAASNQVWFQTQYRTAKLADETQCAAVVDWWQQMIDAGGEGMVVKPSSFVVRGKKGVIQPALKVRGREYLRLIYGPTYDSAENLPRLRKRSVGRKRSLALREFALGVEALERFVKREPLRKIHECVFGVLALESEPVDPRL